MARAATDLQARFAAAYVRNGGNAKAAAIEAGYSARSADDLGPRQLLVPRVQEMIMSELARQRSRAGTVGLHVLVEVAQNGSAPAPARVAAGRALLEFAGLANASKAETVDRDGAPAPDYKAVLDAVAAIWRQASAKPETLQ